MKQTIRRIYDFLLDDHEKFKDFKEGNKVGKYTVYGSGSEMMERFSKVFNKKTIHSACVLFGEYPFWHYESCTILYEVRSDKEIPNRPLCFGYLTVVGTKSNVEKVNTILISSFPRIDDLVHEYEY